MLVTSIPVFTACRLVIEQVSEAAKQISTLKAREDDQNKRRKAAEEESDKIRKVRVSGCFIHPSQDKNK